MSAVLPGRSVDKVQIGPHQQCSNGFARPKNLFLKSIGIVAEGDAQGVFALRPFIPQILWPQRRFFLLSHSLTAPAVPNAALNATGPVFDVQHNPGLHTFRDWLHRRDGSCGKKRGSSLTIQAGCIGLEVPGIGTWVGRSRMGTDDIRRLRGASHNHHRDGSYKTKAG